MNKVAKLGLTEEEKTHTAITKDGQEWSGDMFDAIMTTFTECSLKTLREMEKVELFKRLTVNFIQSNTDSDLREYVKHRAILKIMDIIIKKS